MPARLPSSSAIKPAGRRGATLAFLDLGATLATTPLYGALALFLYKGQHSLPGIVARFLPLGELPVEETVRGTLVDVG